MTKNTKKNYVSISDQAQPTTMITGLNITPQHTIKTVRPEFLTPMKVLDTPRKRKIIKQNAQRSYLAYTMNKNKDKYQCTSARVCRSYHTNTQQYKVRTNLTNTKQYNVRTQQHGISQVKDRCSSTIQKAISRHKLRQ